MSSQEIREEFKRQRLARRLRAADVASALGLGSLGMSVRITGDDILKWEEGVADLPPRIVVTLMDMVGKAKYAV